MLKRIFKAPQQSYFLMGPRGSGKSTWLRATYPDAHVIDLLSEETYQRLLANPGHFANELRAVPNGKWVIVDEVQRLPGLLNEVHRFIEEKSLRFILCGSSARKLKRAGAELKGLGRRIIVYPNGPVLQTKDGIDVMPYQNFADQLADNSLWV
jgi:predicted AAA+ superfamily ATPase